MPFISKTVAAERLAELCTEGKAMLATWTFNEQRFVKWKRDIRIAVTKIFQATAVSYMAEIDNSLSPPDGVIETNGILATQRLLPILQSMRDEVKLWSADQETPKLSSPVELFDTMKFHPKVIEASRGLFADGHYADAILRAFIAVTAFVKERSGSSLDGKALMASVFSEEKPIIKINDFKGMPDHDEQEGFKFIFMGAQVGIRNPKAHTNVTQSDPFRTHEYLSLASLLMKRTDEGKVSESS